MVAAAGALALASCGGGKQAPAARPVTVSVALVDRRMVDLVDEYPGVVTPITQVEIVSQVTGTVTGIYFTDGQRVSKGQSLYSIDKQQFQAQYNQAVANLNAAKANLEKAQKDAERYTNLAEQDAVARQLYDNAMANLESTRMQVEAARENVENQSAYLRYSDILSPIDGAIGFSNVKQGALVSAGATRLNTVSATDPIAVDFYINEKEVPDFMKAIKRSTGRDSLFMLLLPDGSRFPAQGKVYAVDRAINPQTATLKVRLSFANPNDVLKDGMSATVQVRKSGTAAQKLVPSRAIVEQMGEYFVYLMTEDSTVNQQRITPGRVTGYNTVVLSGLGGGETVVVDGIQKLKPGMKVSVSKTL